MKLKLIAAAVAALGASVSQAAPLDPQTTTVSAANTYYVAGASAQSQAFNAVAKKLFDVPNDVVQITAANSGTCAGKDNSDINKHVAYLGKRGGQPTLLIYRNKDGSGGGVQQLLANDIAASAISGTNGVGTTGGGVVITLPAGAATGASGTWTATSSNCTATLARIALSDVKTNELDATVTAVAGTTNYDTLAAIKPALSTGLQGFGVAVSASLYNALINANNAAGIALVNGTQPSIRKADYTSLTAKTGLIKSAAKLLNNASDTTPLELARRVAYSGTQAASQLYFLAAKTGGEAVPTTTADSVAGVLTVTENSSTGNVKTKLNSATAYVIGVMSLENVPSGTDTWKWVAIDGKSPNLAYDLADSTTKTDPYQRQNLASGSYDFGYQSYVLYKEAALGAAGTVTTAGVAYALTSQIRRSSYSNLPGFAYQDLPGTWKSWDSSAGYTNNANKQSRVKRGNSNLKPLMY